MSTFQCQFKFLSLLIITSTSIPGFSHSGQVHPGVKSSLVLVDLFYRGIPARSSASKEISWAFLTLPQRWFLYFTQASFQLLSSHPGGKLWKLHLKLSWSQPGFTQVWHGEGGDFAFSQDFLAPSNKAQCCRGHWEKVFTLCHWK